jgi:hypothetical protein
MQSAKVTERIYAKAFELLEQHPEGLHFVELRSRIEESDQSFHPKTVNGCVWKLVQKFPDKVYKPSLVHFQCFLSTLASLLSGTFFYF